MFFFLQKSLEKTKYFLKSLSFRFNRIVSLRIKETYFKLFIRKKNIQAHSVYGFMSDDKHVYELAIITCLNNVIGKYKNIIFADIGSFIGFYAIYFSKLTNDLNKVYAIESNELYCDDIKRSLKLNNLNNVEICNAILSDKDEEQIFYREFALMEENLNSVNFQNKKLYEEIKNNSKKNITTKLDNLFLKDEKKPNILKIDVHGAEGKVIRGGKDLLKKNVNVILLELHSQNYLNIYSEGIKREEIISDLNQLGFKTYLISPFREIDRKRLDNEFLENKKKLNFKEVNRSNAECLFFGNTDDTFILCLDETCAIKDLECFY